LSADVSHRSGLAGERNRSGTQLNIKASCRRRPQQPVVLGVAVGLDLACRVGDGFQPADRGLVGVGDGAGVGYYLPVGEACPRDEYAAGPSFFSVCPYEIPKDLARSSQTDARRRLRTAPMP
jgi:hypothetical protein